MTNDADDRRDRAQAAVDVFVACVEAGDRAAAQVAVDAIADESLWREFVSDSGLPYSRIQDFLAAVQDEIPEAKRLYPDVI